MYSLLHLVQLKFWEIVIAIWIWELLQYHITVSFLHYIMVGKVCIVWHSKTHFQLPFSMARQWKVPLTRYKMAGNESGLRQTKVCMEFLCQLCWPSLLCIPYHYCILEDVARQTQKLHSVCTVPWHWKWQQIEDSEREAVTVHDFTGQYQWKW